MNQHSARESSAGETKKSSLPDGVKARPDPGRIRQVALDRFLTAQKAGRDLDVEANQLIASLPFEGAGPLVLSALAEVRGQGQTQPAKTPPAKTPPAETPPAEKPAQSEAPGPPQNESQKSGGKQDSTKSAEQDGGEGTPVTEKASSEPAKDQLSVGNPTNEGDASKQGGGARPVTFLDLLTPNGRGPAIDLTQGHAEISAMPVTKPPQNYFMEKSIVEDFMKTSNPSMAQSRLSLVLEAISTGILEGSIDGAGQAATGFALSKISSKFKIPYLSGMIEIAALSMGGPRFWWETVKDATSSKWQKAASLLKDPSATNIMESLILGLEGLGGLLSAVASLCNMLAVVLGLSGLILTVLGVGAALLASAATFGHAGFVLGLIGMSIGLFILFLRARLIIMKSMELLFSKSDPEVALARAEQLKIHSQKFSKSLVAGAGKSAITRHAKKFNDKRSESATSRAWAKIHGHENRGFSKAKDYRSRLARLKTAIAGKGRKLKSGVGREAVALSRDVVDSTLGRAKRAPGEIVAGTRGAIESAKGLSSWRVPPDSLKNRLKTMSQDSVGGKSVQGASLGLVANALVSKTTSNDAAKPAEKKAMPSGPQPEKGDGLEQLGILESDLQTMASELEPPPVQSEAALARAVETAHFHDQGIARLTDDANSARSLTEDAQTESAGLDAMHALLDNSATANQSISSENKDIAGSISEGRSQGEKAANAQKDAPATMSDLSKDKSSFMQTIADNLGLVPEGVAPGAAKMSGDASAMANTLRGVDSVGKASEQVSTSLDQGLDGGQETVDKTTSSLAEQSNETANSAALLANLDSSNSATIADLDAAESDIATHLAESTTAKNESMAQANLAANELATWRDRSRAGRNARESLFESRLAETEKALLQQD